MGKASVARILSSAFCILVVAGCGPGGPPVQPPPAWTAKQTTTGVVRIVHARGSNLAGLATQRRDQLAAADIAEAIARAVASGMQAKRADFVGLPDDEFANLVKTVSEAAGAASASMSVLKQECVLVKRGDKPEAPGNETHAAFQLAEIPRGTIKQFVQNLLTPAQIPVVNGVIDAIAFLRAGEVQWFEP